MCINYRPKLLRITFTRPQEIPKIFFFYTKLELISFWGKNALSKYVNQSWKPRCHSWSSANDFALAIHRSVSRINSASRLPSGPTRGCAFFPLGPFLRSRWDPRRNRRMVKRWIATSLAARLCARRNSGALRASLPPSVRVPREHRAAPAPRRAVTKSGEGGKGREGGRKRFDKRMAGTRTWGGGGDRDPKKKRTRGVFVGDETLGGRSVQKKDERQEGRWRARTRQLSRRRKRETEGPTGGTGSRNEKEWKKIRRSVDRTPRGRRLALVCLSLLLFLRFLLLPLLPSLLLLLLLSCRSPSLFLRRGVQYATQTQNMSWLLAVPVVCFLVPTCATQDERDFYKMY